MKTCTKCKEIKPLTEYHNDKSKRDGLREQCKECRCKHPKIVHKNCIACGDSFLAEGYAKAQKYCGEKCQRMHLRYGINEYKYEDLLISQNYKCAICNNEETSIDKRTGKVYELAVDHCHKTGQVRGLLCANCNGGLGNYNDDITRLKKAIEYLEKHSGLEMTETSKEYRNKYRPKR